jgi:hypothetical protein
MTRSKILPIAVLITAIAFTISPWLSDGFAGFSPEQFPVQQDFWPVQPIGWAFSIWGVIYIWLIIGSLWGLLNAPYDKQWNSMRPSLLASLGIGTFWVAAANASPILATLMIIAMAVLAIRAMLQAGLSDPTWQVRPIALYAGWLTAATGVGIAVVLSGYGLLSSQTAALSMLSCVLLVALYVQSRRRNEWVYPFAVIWALCGIIAANLPSQNWPVIGMSSVGTLILTVNAFK